MVSGAQFLVIKVSQRAFLDKNVNVDLSSEKLLILYFFGSFTYGNRYLNLSVSVHFLMKQIFYVKVNYVRK